MFGATVLAGCAPTPVIRGPRATGGAEAPTPSATPTVPVAQVSAMFAEQRLAALARVHTTRLAAWKAPAGAANWLAAVATQCDEHARRLARLDPLVATSPVAPPPNPAPTTAATPPADWKAFTALFAREADATSAAHQRLAVAAEDPSAALLYASLAIAAHGARTLGPLPEPGKAVPAHVEVGSRPEALAVLLSQLRALVQGLQVGIGQLPLPHERYTPARERLTTVLGVRDRVQATMTAEKVGVEASAVSYEMPGKLDQVADIVHTWGLLENRVLDAWLRLAAASPEARQRESALNDARGQLAAVHSNGIALPHWPGWV